MDFLDGRGFVDDEPSDALSAPVAARPPRPRITREAILSEALALLDAEGLDGLTMRRLASRLGIQAMSLYHHLPNKAALLDAVAAALLLDMAPRGPVVGWRGYLESSARGLRAALQAHPNARPLFALRPIPWSAVAGHLDTARARMKDVGIPPVLRERILESVSALVLGFELGRTSGQDAAADAAFELGLGALLDGLEAARTRARR